MIITAILASLAVVVLTVAAYFAGALLFVWFFNRSVMNQLRRRVRSSGVPIDDVDAIGEALQSPEFQRELETNSARRERAGHWIPIACASFVFVVSAFMWYRLVVGG